MRRRAELLLLIFPFLAAAAGCRAEAGTSHLVGNIPTTQSNGPTGAWVTATGASAPSCDAPAGTDAGHVVFRLPDKRVWRLEAKDGARPEDVSRELDKISPGVDGFVNVSPDGEWLLVQT